MDITVIKIIIATHLQAAERLKSDSKLFSLRKKWLYLALIAKCL